MKALIFGATGMVGQGVLRESLLAADVEQVVVVGRTAVETTDPKLQSLVVPDLTRLGAVETQLQGFDACFFCLGVSSSGMDEAQYSRLTYDLAMTTRAFTNPPSIMTSTNKPEWRRMQQPAANGHGNARSLAGFYAGLLDGSLLESEMLDELTREHSLGEDKTLLTQTRFGLGCMLDQPDVPNATYGLGPRAFGHPGAGGSIGFADPEHDVAFGFVTNTLGPYVLMDPRAQKLVRVLAACL